MSFLPGEKLRYAETHFKFKLPWSLLYKPWPEIIFDAPFQFVPGVEPMLWIVVRDADHFPTKLKTVEIQLKRTADNALGNAERSALENATETAVGNALGNTPESEPGNAAGNAPGNAPGTARQPNFSICKDLNLEVHEQMKFIPLALGKIPAGTYEAHCKLTVERNGKTQTFERWNLPRLKPVPLRFKVLNEALPIAPGYAAGEMHCHTHYSADHVEYGATPEVFQQAAKAVGLDFVSCTDHAYDFAFTQEDFTKEAESPVPRFQKLRDEIAALPTTDENGNRLPLLIAGEEVSAGNSKGENVHMTVLGPEGYLPGLGDCGRYWLENRPTRSIKQILNMTEAHCFAAHPFQQMGLLEKFVFRRGYWKPEDLNWAPEKAQENNSTSRKHSIRGLQFWNGIRDEGFKLGREFWINELGKGNYLLPIGGNDAHGDLNSMTAVSMPLFSLKHTRAHTFGNVRTVVKIMDPVEASPLQGDNSTSHPEQSSSKQSSSKLSFSTEGRETIISRIAIGSETITSQSLNAAFSGDNCYITDGPALWWERSDKEIIFHARSNKEMGGGFRYIRIFGRRELPNGKLAPTEEIMLGSLIATPDHADIPVATFGFAYVRAECETATGKFALTSAARVR